MLLDIHPTPPRAHSCREQRGKAPSQPPTPFRAYIIPAYTRPTDVSFLTRRYLALPRQRKGRSHAPATSSHKSLGSARPVMADHDPAGVEGPKPNNQPQSDLPAAAAPAATAHDEVVAPAQPSAADPTATHDPAATSESQPSSTSHEHAHAHTAPAQVLPPAPVVAPPVFATAASIARPHAHGHPPTTTAAPAHAQGAGGHELPFVTPSSYLRPKPAAAAAMAAAPPPAARPAVAEKLPSPLDKEQMQGLVSEPPPPD